MSQSNSVIILPAFTLPILSSETEMEISDLWSNPRDTFVIRINEPSNPLETATLTSTYVFYSNEIKGTVND